MEINVINLRATGKRSNVIYFLRGECAYMVKVLLQIDEEQVKKDKEFDLSDIYKEIDALYRKAGCYLLENDGNKVL